MPRPIPRTLAVASVAVLAPLALVLAISFVVTPEDVESGRVVLSPTCTYRRIFGRDCPTCGMTRAFAAMSHGRVGDAFRYNRAAPFVYAFWWIGAAAAAAALARATVDLARSRLPLAGTHRSKSE
jgi:hypothetical protein